MEGSQMAEQKDDGAKQVFDADMILELNFVPQWARKSPSEVNYDRFKDGDDGERRAGHSGRFAGGRRDRGAAGRGSARDTNRRERRPGRDSDRRGGRREQSAGEAGRSSSRRHDYTERRPLPLPPVSVRFLPEQKALASLIRQVSATKRAYPLVDLASLLMSKPGLCFVKLEVNRDAPDTALYQCRICRTVSFDRSEIEAHITAEHLEEFFDVEEVEGEPPSGTFVCVAKCGLSGTLLGPPNHHSYAETVKRIHRTRYSNMDFDDYKSRIKVSHDAEDVEHWKAEASRTLKCRLKNSAEDVEPLSWSQAQRYMRDNVVDKNVLKARKAAMSEEVAHKLRDPGLKRLLRMEWQRESRFPLQLSFALRAAFRHKGLQVFKAGKGKGMNFATAVRPAPIDAEHAIPAIHDMITYLREHPGCTKEQIVEALRPGCAMDSEEVKELLQPLHWLADRGHVIEFFNGTFSVPLGGGKR